MDQSVRNIVWVRVLSGLGLFVLGGLFLLWNIFTPDLALLNRAAAFVCVALSGLIYWKFVPSWISFWTEKGEAQPSTERAEKGVLGRLFLLFLAVDLLYLLLIPAMQLLSGQEASLSIWRWLDSEHYLNIAKEGYLPLTSDNWDRAVELVFLPGYPCAVRLLYLLLPNELLSGLIVSALFFAASGCAFYRLLRLDYSHAQAMRAVKYLLLCPGVFFFVAPMSEGMFLFFCLLCFYWTRKRKFLLACVAAAVAGFTRSLGITLLVPIFFELVRCFSVEERDASPQRKLLSFSCLLIVPLGLAAYCAVNYAVSADPFHFMVYQSVHWGQRLGLFFETAAYQLERLLACAGTRHPNVIGRWIPSFVSCFFSLFLIAYTAKRLRPSYTAWFILYYIVAIGVTALLSAPRYLMVCFPLLITLMLLTERKWVDRVLSVACAASALVYAFAFVMHWSVW